MTMFVSKDPNWVARLGSLAESKQADDNKVEQQVDQATGLPDVDPGMLIATSQWVQSLFHFQLHPAQDAAILSRQSNLT